MSEETSKDAVELASSSPSDQSASPQAEDRAALGAAADPLNRQPALDYPVVGFGSSAGGLQPLRDILAILPTDTGMSFVLLPHLASDQVSHMIEIAGKSTSMPVGPIAHGVEPEPNHVYVLQPNDVAELRQGRFAVRQRTPEERIPRIIDIFFHSLGEDMQDRSIGVVLSGGDSDGALGLKTIRGEGGVSIVQSPETAQHSSMPRSSISADHVDLVLSPREIGVELARLARQFSRPDVQLLEAGRDVPSEQEEYQRVLQLIRNHSGLDLRQYKQETIRRRIARRMVLLRMESLPDYVRYLQARKDELSNLQEDVLIGVTHFFRDPAFWQAFSTDVLPTFFENRSPQKPVRVWCAGCSTGEEVYSLAITCLEYMTAHGLDNVLQIFGTDASERSIEMARQATYPESIITEIGPERLRRFFTKVDRGYQLSKRVRDLCIFARQNLCSDPPFSHINFLTCRNVLIYFAQNLQRQVMQTFHYALEPGGYLLLGMSETLRDYDDWFIPVDRKNKFYSKVGTGLPGGYHLPMHRVSMNVTLPGQPPFDSDQVWSELELQRAGDRVVLARFAPPGLIINEALDVLQVRGQTSAFVELASGSVSWNLLRVVRESIVPVVRDAAQHAISENVATSKLGHYSFDDGKERQVQIDVLPLSQQGATNRTFMVLFRDTDMPLPQSSEQLSPDLTADEKARLVLQLRQDLSSTRFHLQSLIEERDARNQELVSANEEIQSANEELQSTNEELETTKEELQSANEELTTVNDELQQRNASLTQTGNDLTNLLTSVNIPLLMLTESFEIRQFTPPMEKLLNMRSSDIGRRVSEIRLQLSVENIEPILQDVLDTLGTREMEVQDRTGKWHLLRVRPYRTTENRIEGLVLLLVDIDQLRHSQQNLQEAKDFATSIIASVAVPVVVLDPDCTIKMANESFRELVRAGKREIVGTSLPDLVSTLWGLDGFKGRLQILSEAEPGTVLAFEHQSSTNDPRVFMVKGQNLQADGSRVVLLTMEDITLQRNAETTLATQKSELEKQIVETTDTLMRAQVELRELAAYLFSIQEEERKRIARELHDDVAQRLTALSFGIEQLRSTPEEQTRAAVIDQISSQVDALSKDVRQISHHLHPSILEELGLVAALNALVDEFRVREGMFATYQGSEIPEELPPNTVTAVYRVTQEALRNVAKHAGKTHVKVRLHQQGTMLRLEVRDFGAGFDQESDLEPKGLGAVSMKERARIAGGSLNTTSELGEGTSVVLEVPSA